MINKHFMSWDDTPDILLYVLIYKHFMSSEGTPDSSLDICHI